MTASVTAGKKATGNGSWPQPQYSFDANNHIVGGSYDAAGNLLNDGTHTYTYDAENRISTVDGGNTATYTYDAEGRRASKNTFTYLYDLAGHQVAELNSGSWDRGEVYAGGRHLATYSGGTTYFPHVDWLGTERVRTNTAGNIVETCISLPFGDGQSCTGSDSSPMHFTGKERDSESGLDNFGARYNASSLGRFMTPDPSPNGIAPGDPQSWNLYSYVRNRPTRSVDVGGNWATDVHAEIVTVALQGLVSAGDLKQLVAEQYVMDKNQAPEFQYRHAMSNGQSNPPQSAAEASSMMWDYVATMMAGASATLGPNGQFNSVSLGYLGDAIHTVEDSTSPMHTSPSGEPLPWRGVGPLGLQGAQHWQGENSPSDSWAGFGQAVRLTMAAFLQANPELAKKNGLTQANLNAEADRRISQYVENFYRMSGNVMSTNHVAEDAARQCALGNPAACDH